MAFIHGTEICVCMEENEQRFKPMHELKAGDVIHVPVAQDGVDDIYYTLKEEDLEINKYYKGLIYKLSNGQHITEDQIVVISRLIEDHRVCVFVDNELILFDKDGNKDGIHYDEYRQQLKEENKTHKLKMLANYTRLKVKDLNNFLKENNTDNDSYDFTYLEGNCIFPKEIKIEKIYEYEGVVHSIKTPTGLLFCRHNDDVSIAGCDESNEITTMKEKCKEVADKVINDFKTETEESLKAILEEKFNDLFTFPVTVVKEDGVSYDCIIKYRDTRIDNCDKYGFNYTLRFDVIRENKMLEFKFEDSCQAPEGWAREPITKFFERWVSYQNDEVKEDEKE